MLMLGLKVSLDLEYRSFLETLSSDLASMLQNPPVQQREIFSHALRIIRSMELSPSCNHLAALTLINSCQSLEMSAKGSSNAKTKGELILDEVKSEYAVRLAVCELNGAKESRSHDELCYPEAASSQVIQCLRALESRPQSWTSYSNAKQNAVVMCQASRDAIERDEKLSLYRSLAEVTSDITSALAKSVQEAQAQHGSLAEVTSDITSALAKSVQEAQAQHGSLAEVTSDITSALAKSVQEAQAQHAEQMAFAEAVRASQAQALSGLKNGRNETLSALSELMVDMRSGIQNMINTMSQAWMAAEARVDELNETLYRSRVNLHETREGILNLFKDTAIANSEHTVSQIQQWQLSHESALRIQQTLDLVRTNQLQLLSEAFARLSNAVHGSSELMTQMYQRQNLLDQRLANLDITLEAFQITAANLKSTVDETTEKIQQIAIFSGIGAMLGRWGGMLFVIAGIWFASKRVTVCFIAGITWLFYTAGVLTWLGGASDQVRQAALVRIISITTYASNFPCFITLMLEGLLALLCLCLLSLGARSIYLRFVKDDKRVAGLLPEIEA
ncbi:uncharacterized protein K441DRAFT_679545 [Cenococcum geophilum 1.58]|uniref:uncharacterized protein n=1 Tax=Cenococcum geophilum 1.58 TaxID=794803 RepID=UPI00358E6789|nr:hypothetical protein K441DRAFT_679545 [Cenococcum geophilum 1.58]